MTYEEWAAWPPKPGPAPPKTSAPKPAPAPPAQFGDVCVSWLGKCFDSKP